MGDLTEGRNDKKGKADGTVSASEYDPDRHADSYKCTERLARTNGMRIETLPSPTVTPPSSFRSSSILSPSSAGGSTARSTTPEGRNSSSSSSRPLSILSTFSAHRREPAEPTAQPTPHPNPLPSPPSRRRDSRGLQAASRSKNFEDDLVSGETRRLRSDSVSTASSSTRLRVKGPEGSSDVADYSYDASEYYDYEGREQEILKEEPEPPSTRPLDPPVPIRTPSSTPTLQQTALSTPPASSSPKIDSSTPPEARTRTASADTTSSLTPKPPHLPSFPSTASSVYFTTASLALFPGMVPAPPLVVPPTPTTTSTSPSEPSSSRFGGARRSTGSTTASPSSYNGPRVFEEEEEDGEKRRSLFRVGGTASSPDLANLIRKKKDARAAAAGLKSLSPVLDSSDPSTGNSHRQPESAPPPTPEKDFRQVETWAGGRLEDLDGKKANGASQDEEQQEILGDEWDTRFDSAREHGVLMPGVRAIGLGFGNVEKETFNKSIRNKAKNVFSKMFSSPSPAKPPRASPSATSLRFPPSVSSSSLAAPTPHGQPSPSRTPSSSRRPSATTTSTTPPSNLNLLPPLGPVSPFLKKSTTSPPTLHDRRFTDAPKKQPLAPVGGGSPKKSSSGHLLPSGNRRRSLSVGGMSGTKGWEVDVEGALDGIVQRTPPTSPTEPETRLDQVESEEGARQVVLDLSKDEDESRNGFAPSSRYGQGQHMTGGVSPTFNMDPNPHAFSRTTTITTGRGPAKRVVIGKRKLSNPPRPSLSSTNSSPLSSQGPLPPPKSRGSISSQSPAQDSSSPTLSSTRHGNSRSPTPSDASSPGAPKPSPRKSSLQSPAPTPTASPSLCRSVTPPASPIRGHFPIQPPPSSQHTPPGRSTPTSPAVRSLEEAENGSKESTPSTLQNFQEQTIRLVPASPSNRPPALPSSSVDLFDSPPLPPLPAPSPPNPTFVHTAPDDELDGTVGLGIAGARVEDKPLEGETDEEKGLEAARRILEDDQSLKWVRENRVCEFLGGTSPIQKIAVSAYMASYDFKGLKLEMAVRRLTSKLYFKAESQELDRVIGALALRFWDCNPSGLYGSSDVVHQLIYALLLLNTDLHVVDQEKKMSRDGFVENTMGSIRTWAAQQTPATSNIVSDSIREDGAASIRGGDVFHEANGDGSNLPTSDSASAIFDSSAVSTIGRTMKRGRSGSIASSLREKIAAHGSTPALVSSQVASITSASASSVALNTPGGSMGDPRPSISRFGSSSTSLGAGSFVLSKSWVYDMETLLKDMYTAVKAQRILQPVGEVVSASHLDRPSASLRSTPSSLSRGLSLRSYSSNTMNSKRNSIRGLGFLSDTLGSRSRLPTDGSSTLDGRTSPTPSHATSLGEGLHSNAYPFPGPAMGFAHNLSRTIIQEQDDDDQSLHSTSSKSTEDELSDEVMALEGPPWAKEGMVTRRIAFVEDKKKSKDKTWKPLFAVAQAGTLATFTFGEGSSSRKGGGVVGGGNWTSNAQAHHQINLVHSLAQTLPKPGYNRSRPFVFSVKECTGAITYFEVGTESITEEWTLTCNYWAARLSQPPLVGGVSNMDYGWGRPVYGDDGTESVRSRSSTSRQRTISSSGGGGGVFINDWNPPYQGNSQSTLPEQTQLEALVQYKKKLVQELVEFSPMERFLAPGQKPRDNYARKLAFLEGQVLKYSAYVQCLTDAVAARYKKKGDNKQIRDLRRAEKTSSKSATSLRSVDEPDPDEEEDEDDDDKK